MKKENALIDELNRIAEKPYVDGEALGRFLMRSYRAVVDKSIKQADMRLFSETEKRLFSSGFYSENENYAAYRGLYYVFYPIMHKAKMLNETLSLSY